MIVCSCNVLTKQQILDTVATETAGAPRTPVQTYRCLGCAPDCGRCLVTVRAILTEARGAQCAIGCAECPGHRDHPESEFFEAVYPIAAE
jgi:bacterioferritin-associated ferredoxin